jgi:type II secretion system protein G
MNNKLGFTLIELLVVVAIISILASIAIPNYQHAQVKAKTTASFAELKTLSTAVEAYHLDNNTYPLDGNDYPMLSDEFFDQKRIQHVLTTPIAYISEIPDDLFHRRDTHLGDPKIERYFQSRSPHPYLYYSVDNYQLHRGTPRAYYLFSFGPDLIYNNESNKPGTFTAYDQTNGIISDGDIFYKGP